MDLEMSVCHLLALTCCFIVQFLLHVGVHCARTAEEIDLNGVWLLTNEHRSHILDGQVPGSMYTDLVRNGTIGDPVYRYNDVQYKWVAHDNWVYSRTFQVSSDLLKRNQIALVCDGLDTVAIVSINGKNVGESDNMFVRYVFDIKPQLKEGQNNVTIQFVSAPEYARMMALIHSYPIPPKCPPDVQHGECFVNFIRKEQCSFSWDWGPSFPTQGIWKNISVQAFDSAVVRDVTVETIPADSTLSSWTVRTVTFFDAVSTTGGQLEVTIPELGFTMTKQVTATTSEGSVLDIILDKSHNVELWWPNGHGRQILYTLKVNFTASGNSEWSAKTIRFGFRTIELVQEKIKNSTGLSFYFKVNNIAIFMKGSNWIPADSFQERVTRSRLKNLLQSAADANMNMLRVWGGGIYEQDIFYDLADELGILIWQDFMFACALYPVNEQFLDTVKQEITYQVRRLKHHPSIAAWAGNNENEGALGTNWYDITEKDFPKYKSDYVTLYIDTIMRIVKSEDSSRPFLPSSPTNGEKTASEGWVSANVYDTHYGDVHTYNYFDDSWDWRTIPRPRFASEYGFQSWPSALSLQNISNTTDWDYFGNFASHRQHHENGNLEMVSEAMRHLKLPNCSSPVDRFKYLIYISQINQAVSIKTQTEFYLRSQSELVNGEGHTMGALYWQLNDIWQAPTWSSLEYSGKWKMLHYFAKKFFSPVLLSPYLDKGMLKVYLVQNNATPVAEQKNFKNKTSTKLHYFKFKDNKSPALIHENEINIQRRFVHKLSRNIEKEVATPSVMYVTCYRWDQFQPLYSWTQEINQVTQASQKIFEGDITQMLQAAGCPLQKQCFFTFHFTPTQDMPDAYIPLTSYATAKGLTRASVKVTKVAAFNDGNLTIEVSSEQIAPFVTLDSGDIAGRFSDNGFLMVVPKVTLIFYPWQDITAEQLIQKITVISLMDIY